LADGITFGDAAGGAAGDAFSVEGKVGSGGGAQVQLAIGKR
jgi:hypothetical protein